MATMIADQGQFIFAPASFVWETLTQVNQWTQWQPWLRAAELLETPKLEAIGKVVPARGKPYHFKIVRFLPESELQVVRPFRLGTDILNTYHLTRNAEGVVLTLEAACAGNLELQVGFLSRRKVARELLEASLRLKEFCEKHYVLEQDRQRHRVLAS